MKKRAWLPNGQLSDGTPLMGPLREKPKDIDSLEIVIDGTSHYVAYCCGELSKAQIEQVRDWVASRLVKRERKSSGTRRSRKS